MTLAFLVAALVSMAAACVPAAAAWADGGAVELGVSVSKQTPSPASGGKGSVDLGIDVALGADAAGRTETAAGGTVDVGIAVAQLGYHEVSFVGIYCDADGNVDASKEQVMLGSQKVAHGGHATAPSGIERDEYWADAWYPANPFAGAGVAAVELADYPVDGTTVFYCLWKRGYAVRLDANNGEGAFGGEVASPGYVMVERDEEYDKAHDGGTAGAADAPAGVDFAVLPAATRPGYVFRGWYWPATADGAVRTDEHGRAVLDEGRGLVAPAAGEGGELVYEGGLSYDFIRDHNGQTLYAKWELDPGVRIELDNSRDDYRTSIWFWPGRGYATVAPRADMEIDAGVAVMTAPGEIGVSVVQNPIPEYNTQFFSGWGFKDALLGEGGAYGDDVLVSCEKVEDGAGGSGTYVYRLTERAFERPYVDPDGLAWVYEPTEPEGDAGGRACVWEALSETAYIRVAAPFEVTFEKAGDGWDADANPDAVEPYSLDELEWAGAGGGSGSGGSSGGGRIQSLPQGFTNLGERSVYISRVDCTDVGASAILPGGADGKRLFKLGERLDGSSALADATAIPFGYAAASNANVFDVDAYDPDAWIVLPAAAEGEQPQAKRLYFELDLKNAAFNRSAIAVGDGTDDRYVAKIANVKYTYSVVP